MSEYAYVVQRGWLAGFYRASKYLLVATLLETTLFFLLLWWLVGVYLSFFSVDGHDPLDVGRELTLLTLSPQIQLIMLGFVISLLLWLYAVFGEAVPSLRELETQGVDLGTPLTIVVAGTITTLTLVATQITILSITAYLMLADVVALISIYVIALAALVAYILTYVGFFLVFDRLGNLLSSKRLVTAGVLVLVSAFIIFLGPVAWFVSFTTLRDLLKTTT